MELTAWLNKHDYPNGSAVYAAVHSLCDTVENLSFLLFEDLVTAGLKVGVARTLLSKIHPNNKTSLPIAPPPLAIATPPRTFHEADEDSPRDSFDDIRETPLVLPPMALMLTSSSGRTNFRRSTWADTAFLAFSP